MPPLPAGWLAGAIGIAVAVPVLLVVLTEIIGALQRRESAAVKPVRFLRNWVLPSAALLAFLWLAEGNAGEDNWVRVVATLLGFLLILLVLSATNVVVFAQARPGSWRDRMPSIFVDLGRLALIVIGVGLLMKVVWGADLGGLIAALGVTSIVLGLALQNAVGGVISGLLLLFEQPFRIGDWLETATFRGRVVEVNWRAVHLRTATGIQVIPNSQLATATFTNLSRPKDAYVAEIDVTLGTDDPPDEVLELLHDVGKALPGLASGRSVQASYRGSQVYRVLLPLAGPADAGTVRAQFNTWLWYASRRAGFALDGDATDPIADPELLGIVVDVVARDLGLAEPEKAHLLEAAHLERYGRGEVVLAHRAVPDAMLYLFTGRLATWVPVGGEQAELGTLEPGDYLGHTVLTREPSPLGVRAAETSTVLVIPRDALEQLVQLKPRLARRIGSAIETTRQHVRDVRAAAAPLAR